MVKPCQVCGKPTECIGGQKYCSACKAGVAVRLKHAEALRQRERLAARIRFCCVCAEPMPLGRTHRYCSICCHDYNTALYSSDPEYGRQRVKDYYAVHPEVRSAYRQRPESRAKAQAASRRRYHANIDVSRANSRANQARRKALMVAGTASKIDYLNLLADAGGVCALCKLAPSGGKLHIDHIIPLSRGGQHTPDNLQALCQPCNQRKYNKLPSEM